MSDTKVLLYYLDNNLGWMNVHKALEKISNKDYHIYAIEHNLKVKLNTFLTHFEYFDAKELCKILITLESFSESDQKLIQAIHEFDTTLELNDIIDQKDNFIYYVNKDNFESSIRENILAEVNNLEIPSYFYDYFNFERYIDDRLNYYFEASNGYLVYIKN